MTERPTAALSPERQALVRSMLGRLERDVSRAFRVAGRAVARDEVESLVRASWAESALRFDASLGVSFEDFASFRAEAVVIDAARVEGKHGRFELALRVASREHLALANDPTNVLEDSDADRRRHRRGWYNAHLAAMALGMFAQAKRAQSEDGFVDREAYTRALRTLDEAKAKLRSRERRLLELHYEQQMKLELVADDLGVSYATAKNIHRSVLERLGAILRAHGVNGAPPPEGARG